MENFSTASSPFLVRGNTDAGALLIRLIRHHLGDLTERPGGVFAGIGGVGVALLLAVLTGTLRHFRCCVDNVAIERVLMLHEMRRRQA